jgi:serine/threonine protein kinase
MLGSYGLGSVIHQGQECWIYETTNVNFVHKILNPLSPSLYRELMVGFGFEHPNIQQFKAVAIFDENAFLLQPRGTPIVQAFQEGLVTTRDVLTDVLDAVMFLHSNGLTHGNISIDNLIVIDGKVKLIDFGAAQFCEGNDLASIATTILAIYRKVFDIVDASEIPVDIVDLLADLHEPADRRGDLSRHPALNRVIQPYAIEYPRATYDELDDKKKKVMKMHLRTLVQDYSRNPVRIEILLTAIDITLRTLVPLNGYDSPLFVPKVAIAIAHAMYGSSIALDISLKQFLNTLKTVLIACKFKLIGASFQTRELAEKFFDNFDCHHDVVEEILSLPAYHTF